MLSFARLSFELTLRDEDFPDYAQAKNANSSIRKLLKKPEYAFFGTDRTLDRAQVSDSKEEIPPEELTAFAASGDAESGPQSNAEADMSAAAGPDSPKPAVASESDNGSSRSVTLWELFHYAIDQNLVDDVRTLLEKYKIIRDVAQRHKAQLEPKYGAKWRPSQDLTSYDFHLYKFALRKNNPEIIAMLEEAGANPPNVQPAKKIAPKLLPDSPLVKHSPSAAAPPAAADAKDSKAVTNRVAIVDVDGTLLIMNVAGKWEINEALIAALLENGIKEVYLFTNMADGDQLQPLSGKPTREQLIAMMKIRGLNVLGVITPYDHVHPTKKAGAVYNEDFKSIIKDYYDEKGVFKGGNHRVNGNTFNEAIKVLNDKFYNQYSYAEFEKYCMRRIKIDYKDYPLPLGSLRELLGFFMQNQEAFWGAQALEGTIIFGGALLAKIKQLEHFANALQFFEIILTYFKLAKVPQDKGFIYRKGFMAELAFQIAKHNNVSEVIYCDDDTGFLKNVGHVFVELSRLKCCDIALRPIHVTNTVTKGDFCQAMTVPLKPIEPRTLSAAAITVDWLTGDTQLCMPLDYCNIDLNMMHNIAGAKAAVKCVMM